MNAGGLAEGIAESELFGHVKGAFTDARVDRIGCFELADEGTLFLDEIANMPMRLQAKLLRVLQTGEMAARRLVARPLRQRARALGHQRRPAGRDRRRAVSRGPPLPSEHRRHPPAAAARAPRGHRARWPRISWRIYAARYRKPIAGFDAGRDRGAARAPLARQRARAGAQHRARGADGGPRGDDDRGAAPQPASARGGAKPPPTATCRSRRPSACSSRRSWRATAATSGSRREQLGMSRSALYRRLQQYGVRE